MDEEKQQLFAAVDDTVIQIRLSDNNNTVLASRTVGSGIELSSITGMQQDPVTGNLILVSEFEQQLIELDILTGERRILMENLPSFIKDLEYDSLNERWLILTWDSAVLTLDFENNQVVPLLESCDIDGVDRFGSSSKFMSFNREQNTLLIGSNGLLEYDFDTHECRHYRQWANDALYLDEHSFLMIEKRGIYQFSLQQDQSFVISN